MDELAAKRERVLSRMKADRRSGRMETVSSLSPSARKRRFTSNDSRRGRKPKRRRHTSDLEKGHHCTSACRGRHALSDDEDFIVHDTDDDDSEDGDSGGRGGAGHSWYPGLSSDTSSDEAEAEATTESDVEAGDGADREQKKSKSKSRKARLLERQEKGSLGRRHHKSEGGGGGGRQHKSEGGGGG